jgi:hypothetical protein
VTILCPEHLFEQADKLIAPPPAGTPRQVDLRRAVSAAYYGVFHATLTALADLFVGVTKRSTAQYGLAYRSLDHGSLRALCSKIIQPNLPAKYAAYQAQGFCSEIKAFSAAVVELQEKRHAADYDPTTRIKSSDALAVVGTARRAVRRFGLAEQGQRDLFLTLLVFPPR